MQWRMEIGYFYSHSGKLLKLFQANFLKYFITIFNLKSIIILFIMHLYCYFVMHLYLCLYYFCHTFVKQLIRRILFRIPLCLITCVSMISLHDILSTVIYFCVIYFVSYSHNETQW